MNALNALQNPACAQLIDGGTGQAADIILSNLFGTPGAATIQPGTTSNPDSVAEFSPDSQPNPLVLPSLFSQGAGDTSTITINSNGYFFNGYPDDTPFNYSDQIDQAVTVLHEVGHSVGVYNAGPNYSPIVPGAITGVLPDGGDALGGMVSQTNTERVAETCFPGQADD